MTLFFLVAAPRDLFSPGNMLKHACANQRRQNKGQQNGPGIDGIGALFDWRHRDFLLLTHLVSPFSRYLLQKKNSLVLLALINTQRA
jgi:hypothetical protein